MKSKVIYLSSEHYKKKQRPLTSKMIVTLLAACAKQKKGIPFGPRDIKGSFAALITRGLIVKKEMIKNEQTEVTWQVTAEAISMLKTMGIKVP